MVVSAALLIRERGAHATAISDVLKHSGAPRGSAYHYFPGGRMQLLEEATDYAGAYIAGKISAAENAVELLDEPGGRVSPAADPQRLPRGLPDRRGDGRSRRSRQSRAHDEGHRARRGGVRAAGPI